MRNVLAVAPTGSGKTVLFSDTINKMRVPTVAIAHRQELIGQISLALARYGVLHDIIAPSATRKAICAIHALELGRVYYDATSQVRVAGVDTLIRRDEPWMKAVQFWVMDEGHHVLKDNKWGRAIALLPNARGLGVTATPARADGKGLGAHADGVMHRLVEGPEMRDLIEMGYLTEYRCFCPPSDVNYTAVPIGASGDYSHEKLAEAVHASNRIVGDVVSHYKKIASGKLGITFAVDVQAATELAAAYRDAGVPAELVTAKTPDSLRHAIIRRFRNRELMQLVNVDLFGEGFDLPAIEVVSMVRKTESWPLFVQQFGRALRPLEGKERGVIIDHVGNIERHGLPDRSRVHSLDRRERRSSKKDDGIPVRICTGCTQPYERVLSVCPYCGTAKPEPAERSAPEFVEGDLHELDPDVLRRMRGDIARVDAMPQYPMSAGPEVRGAIYKRHMARQQEQVELRGLMGLWAGWQALRTQDAAEIQRRFWYRYGIDSVSAQALGSAEARELCEKIRDDLSKQGVTEA